MFESSKQYHSKGKYSHNKRNTHSSYYKKGTAFSKKHKGNLVELDDNYTYQTSNRTLTDVSNKEQKTKGKEVTEFQIIEECEANKENCSCFANKNSFKMEEINITDNITSNNQHTPDNKNDSVTNSNCNSTHELVLLCDNDESDNKENIYTNSNNSNDCSNNNNNNINNNSINNSNNTQKKSILSLSSDALNEAFYFPKKLTNVYNFLYTQYHLQRHLLNNNNNNNQLYPNQQTVSISGSFNSTNCNKCTSYFYNDNSNSNCNNANPLLTSSIPSSYQSTSSNNSLSRNTVTPFTYYDTPYKTMPIYKPKMNPNWNLNDINISPKPVINNIKEMENTEVLKVNIKVSEKETLIFKIRRYDDMFKTVKMFCEINKLDAKFIRPIILYIIKALNSIYGIVNMTLTEEEIETIINMSKQKE